MLRFQKIYFLLACVLFLLEVYIALYVNDNFVRPYVGDFLVVMLLYCAVKSFLNAPAWNVALSVLAFAFFIEGMQYLNVVRLLNLQDFALARVVIGTSFQWIDMVAYTAGIAVVLVIERLCQEKLVAG